MTPRYLFRVAGTVGPAIRSAFASLSVSAEPVRTVVRGTLANAADLKDVFDALGGLRIESVIVDTRQAAEITTRHGRPGAADEITRPG